MYEKGYVLFVRNLFMFSSRSICRLIRLILKTDNGDKGKQSLRRLARVRLRADPLQSVFVEADAWM